MNTAPTRVAVIGAMDEEVAHLAQSLDDVFTSEDVSLKLTHGTYTARSGNTIKVCATVAGMGMVNAAATTQYLVDEMRPDAIIFSGIAGNLNPDLHINDVVLGKTLRYLDSDMHLIAQSAPFTEEYHSDDALIEHAHQALERLGITHIAGTIATGNTFVEGDEKTAQVKALTQADAVEMEGAAVAHVAARCGIPVLVIRALSDNADTEYETFHTFDISEYADTAAKIVVEMLAAW